VDSTVSETPIPLTFSVYVFIEVDGIELAKQAGAGWSMIKAMTA
jgi:hypothetical protein